MSYLEELLPEFRKGVKIRCKKWRRNMIKVPQRDEIWKHKEDGYLARVIYSDKIVVYFYDNKDGCRSIADMENGGTRDWFEENFIFVGNGKPIDVLFEVQDER